MKLVCAAPSVSVVSIVLIRYYSLKPSSIEMVKFKRFLALLIHGMFIAHGSSFKFRLNSFCFKVVFHDGLVCVYQIRNIKGVSVFDSSSPLLSRTNIGY